MAREDEQSLSVQIGFRLTQTFADELAERAQAADMNRSDFVRKIVLDFLATDQKGHAAAITGELQNQLTEVQAETGQIREELRKFHAAVEDQQGELRSVLLDLLERLKRIAERPHQKLVEAQLKRIREDMATAVLAILVQAGRMPAKDAQAWVKENMLSH